MAIPTNIANLYQAQGMLLKEMEETEKIWGQLNSDGFKKGFASQREYSDWRVRAGDAYGYKKKLVTELRDYIQQRFGEYYPDSASLRLALMEQTLEAPDWLQERESEPDAPALAEQHLQEVLGDDKPQRPEISLSLQSQKHLELIMQRLTDARKAREMTQLEVSVMLGNESNVMGQWERGRTSPTLVNIFRLCAIYQVDPVAILTGESSASREDLELILQQFEAGRDYLKGLLGE